MTSLNLDWKNDISDDSAREEVAIEVNPNALIPNDDHSPPRHLHVERPQRQRNLPSKLKIFNYIRQVLVL